MLVSQQEAWAGALEIALRSQAIVRKLATALSAERSGTLAAMESEAPEHSKESGERGLFHCIPETLRRKPISNVTGILQTVAVFHRHRRRWRRSSDFENRRLRVSLGGKVIRRQAILSVQPGQLQSYLRKESQALHPKCRSAVGLRLCVDEFLRETGR
ncbi:MAG: hypothetical protein WCK86_13935 [Planctomycetia bacterium]